MRRAAALALGALLGLAAPAGAGEIVLVPLGAPWRHAPAHDADTAWTALAHDDADWPEGPSGLGFGDGDDATDVRALLRGDAPALALRARHAFTVEAPLPDGELVLRIACDDGFVAWLDGREIARLGLHGTPPAPDEAAEDHEARRAESFTVPGTLSPGRHVLAVQVHDSSLHSSDLSLRPELVLLVPDADVRTAADDEPPLPAPLAPAPRGALRWTTTLAAWHATNYFQGVAGSPQERVTAELVRQELRWRPRREPRADVLLRVEAQRHGALGVAPGALARWSWTAAAWRAQLTVDGSRDRPAFRLGDRLARADALGQSLEWTVPVRGGHDVSAWLGHRTQSAELDPSRDLRDLTLGAAVRWRRPRWPVEPELGLERSRRHAESAVHEHEQLRPFVELHGRVRRARVDALLRWTGREYVASEPSPNAGRRDRRRLVRVSASAPLREGLAFQGFAAWEDGTSSAADRGFDGLTLWTGLSWTP